MEQIYEVVVGVANFEVVDKKTIYKDYAVQILGFTDPAFDFEESDDLDSDSYSDSVSSGLDKAFKGTNLALNVFLLVILAFFLTILIILVRMVRNVMVTRCS